MDYTQPTVCPPEENPVPGPYYFAKVSLGSFALLMCVTCVIILARLRHCGGFYMLMTSVSVLDVGTCLTGLVLTCIPADPCSPFSNYALIGSPYWLVLHVTRTAADWMLVYIGLERILALFFPGKVTLERPCCSLLGFLVVVTASIVGHVLFYYLADRHDVDYLELNHPHTILSVYVPMCIVFVFLVTLLVKKLVDRQPQNIQNATQSVKINTYFALSLKFIIFQIGLVIFVYVSSAVHDNSVLLHANVFLKMIRMIHDIWLIVLFAGLIMKFVMLVVICSPFRLMLLVCSSDEFSSAQSNCEPKPQEYLELE